MENRMFSASSMDGFMRVLNYDPLGGVFANLLLCLFNFTLVGKRTGLGTACIFFGIDHSGTAPVTIPEYIVFEEFNL